MRAYTSTLNAACSGVGQRLLDRHYFRKHGAGGQEDMLDTLIGNKLDHVVGQLRHSSLVSLFLFFPLRRSKAKRVSVMRARLDGVAQPTKRRHL
jgi:hypothetical protein